MNDWKQSNDYKGGKGGEDEGREGGGQGRRALFTNSTKASLSALWKREFFSNCAFTTPTHLSCRDKRAWKREGGREERVRWRYLSI